MSKTLHEAHTFVVLTQLPLRSILRSADYTGRIAKWIRVLGASDIKYMTRTFAKGKVLANLVVEFAEPPLKEVAEKQSDSRELHSRASIGR